MCFSRPYGTPLEMLMFPAINRGSSRRGGITTGGSAALPAPALRDGTQTPLIPERRPGRTKRATGWASVGCPYGTNPKQVMQQLVVSRIRNSLTKSGVNSARPYRCLIGARPI